MSKDRAGTDRHGAPVPRSVSLQPRVDFAVVEIVADAQEESVADVSCSGTL